MTSGGVTNCKAEDILFKYPDPTLLLKPDPDTTLPL